MIEAMDDAIGNVLNTLDELGLTDNTIVCFTSDNGGVSSGDGYASSMLPLRGGKGRQWEGGIREPLYIRYPAAIKAGTICDVPVSGIDFFPTLLEYTGIETPAEQIVDGLSLTPLLKGKTAPSIEERDLFWHYPHYGNQGGEPSSIIRSGQWKLIHYYEDGRDELYNLEEDPGEQTNLHTKNRPVAIELRRRLNHWLEDLDAKTPRPDPLYNPAKEKERRHKLEYEFMPALEAEHAGYLDADWQPNADWWGSQQITD
jgi:arylsulfatase A-like enzyme